jgi:hypothetical protein
VRRMRLIKGDLQTQSPAYADNTACAGLFEL